MNFRSFKLFVLLGLMGLSVVLVLGMLSSNRAGGESTSSEDKASVLMDASSQIPPKVNLSIQELPAKWKFLESIFSKYVNVFWH